MPCIFSFTWTHNQPDSAENGRKLDQSNHHRTIFSTKKSAPFSLVKTSQQGIRSNCSSVPLAPSARLLLGPSIPLPCILASLPSPPLPTTEHQSLPHLTAPPHPPRKLPPTATVAAFVPLQHYHHFGQGAAAHGIDSQNAASPWNFSGECAATTAAVSFPPDGDADAHATAFRHWGRRCPADGTHRLLLELVRVELVGTCTTTTPSRAPTARSSSPKQPPPKKSDFPI
ncbi:Os06g0478100 [Oryza sativa Japonica Group]|uniref:Os06g0478100 protein n=1 Tax=Oryza sativa subsp. japonica TaxID=39947 RepID=C7J3M6_ORYSJ|nr:Os06g0478100 [Oryza sativa Japonica Group]|eukprot:NP_001174790.1 Os06g0478100 [Oryza sativa Japonica Group]